MPHADWVYVRFLPSKEQIEAVDRAKKRAFIAGPTVSGDVPKNWQHCADVGLNAILTDYRLELRAASKSN
jgi:glycerophosphoryl diester phosphodiesterase